MKKLLLVLVLLLSITFIQCVERKPIERTYVGKIQSFKTYDSMGNRSLVILDNGEELVIYTINGMKAGDRLYKSKGFGGDWFYNKEH